MSNVATTQEIAMDIKNTFDSAFVNFAQAGRYLGMGKDKCRSFLADLPFYATGRERKYYALDIARLMDKTRTFRKFG